MVILVPAALPTSTGPYAVVMGVGFLIGIYGHLAKSRTLILTGILIVGLISAIFAFVVGKLV
ncbi:MAG TPA: hypothetical protein VMD09_07505 [Solirubrobacteraceae bacterium]|nr:hypothetical protein [Solirubrobacteraceae bacterium]